MHEQRGGVADALDATLQRGRPGIVGAVVAGDAVRALPAVVILAAEFAGDARHEQRRDHARDQQRRESGRRCALGQRTLASVSDHQRPPASAQNASGR